MTTEQAVEYWRAEQHKAEQAVEYCRIQQRLAQDRADRCAAYAGSLQQLIALPA